MELRIMSLCLSSECKVTYAQVSGAFFVMVRSRIHVLGVNDIRAHCPR